MGEEKEKEAPEAASHACTSTESANNNTQNSTKKRLIMEVGCGNGSAILSFLKHCPSDDYVCFDISATAVRLLREHTITKSFMEGRGWWLEGEESREKGAAADEKESARPPLTTFVYDICDKVNELDEAFLAKKALLMSSRQVVASPLPSSQLAGGGAPFAYSKGTVDQMLLVFVLCALPTVEDMLLALKRMAFWLKPGRYGDNEAEAAAAQSTSSSSSSSPTTINRKWVGGGRLLFRDYAILDHNMLRFLERPAKSSQQAKHADVNSTSSSSPAKVTSPFFQKGDGTSQFFFEHQFTLDLFAQCGLVPITMAYHCNEVRNRKNGKVMRKVFINAEFGVLAADE